MSAAKKKPLTPAQLEIVARLFAALAEPSRLSLLQALQPGPLSVGELMEASGLKQANVSKHLAILYDKRLVKRERDGTTIRYEIADPMVFSLCDLVCSKMKRDARETVAVYYPNI